MNYATLQYQYGEKNVKQLGNKVIAICKPWGNVYGYTIASYDGSEPNELVDKVFTFIDVVNNYYPGAYAAGTFDKIHDYFYGNPIYSRKEF